MTAQRCTGPIWAVTLICLVVGSLLLVAACYVFAADGKSAGNRPVDQPKADLEDVAGPYVVTPAAGPSWLKLIGIVDIRFTSMGQMGGDAPPPPSPRMEPDFPLGGPPRGGGMGMGGMGMGGMMGRNYSAPQYSPYELERMMSARFSLAGSDFYRLDCRSCHGPNGDGAPPEIKSLIGPLQATSPALIEARMKKSGRPIGEQMAKELASQAQADILKRLQEGGKQMPPFRHLEGEEVNALMQYLKQRVGAPEARGKDILVTESVARVGEHLVKGTCAICHDATGPGMRGGGMMRGIIPSLASFPYEQSMQSVVRQVELGSRPMMMMGGLRMPAYPYITPSEAASAYLYLVQYPPY
jgi:mono/diheme cytochrome c family protein